MLCRNIRFFNNWGFFSVAVICGWILTRHLVVASPKVSKGFLWLSSVLRSCLFGFIPSMEKFARGQLPVLTGDLQGNVLGRAVGGRGCAWLCFGTAIRAEPTPADLCWCFPTAWQLEKLLSCGGKGSELSCVGGLGLAGSGRGIGHIWERTFSLLTLPGLGAQNCIHHADAFPLERFSSKWS